MSAFRRVLALTFLVLVTIKWLPATTLKAGVAKVDITPPVGVPLWGYELRASTGTLDPLYARVLVLEVGDKRLALVTLDLGRTFGHDSIERLRRAAAASSGISTYLSPPPTTTRLRVYRTDTATELPPGRRQCSTRSAKPSPRRTRMP